MGVRAELVSKPPPTDSLYNICDIHFFNYLFKVREKFIFRLQHCTIEDNIKSSCDDVLSLKKKWSGSKPLFIKLCYECG